MFRRPEQRSWYSDWLRAVMSGVRTPVEATFSGPIQTVPRPTQPPVQPAIGSLSRWYSSRGAGLTAQSLLCLVCLSMSTAILNVCGSVHLGNICFILIQLNGQYSMFLKSLLAQHVSHVRASIVRNTTAVYNHRFFGFWCVYSMRLVMVLGHIVTLSRSVSDLWLYTTVLRLTMDAVTPETCWANKLFRNIEYYTFSWIRIKHILLYSYLPSVALSMLDSLWSVVGGLRLARGQPSPTSLSASQISE
jgi:hypothetical protein